MLLSNHQYNIMKLFYSFLILAFSINISAQGIYTNEDNEQQQWGEITVQDLQKSPFDIWYKESQEYYNPKKNEKLASKLKKLKDLRVLVYMGTWCSDSQDWVPKFVKLWETMGLTMKNVKIVGVHDAEDKRKQTPDGSEKKYNIEMVPTFIFLKGDKEIGRIVEFPETELEDDVAKIILGES